jgi:hypothetical protein
MGGRVGFGCCTCFACCLFQYNQSFYNQPGSTLADLALDSGVLASIEANVFTTCDTVYNVVQTRLRGKDGIAFSQPSGIRWGRNLVGRVYIPLRYSSLSMGPKPLPMGRVLGRCAQQLQGAYWSLPRAVHMLLPVQNIIIFATNT